MAVRVKVNIKFGKSEVQTTALANSGYEGDEAEVVIPIGLAKKYSLLKKNLPEVTYITAGGKAKFYRFSHPISLMVITEDKKSEIKECKAVISPQEDEVIINDIALGKLKIVILNAGERIWKFSDDRKVRHSENKQTW